ncbi:VSK receptor [Vibrio parahaemolyticus]
MEWLVDLFNKLLVFLYQLLISLVNMLKDLFFWAVEQIMAMVNLLLSGVFSLFAPVDMSQYMTSIPPTVAWVMAAVGSIILAAITVRLMLQFIPFTRLGS